MKLQAMDIVGQEAGESRNQVHRYIRLTELIPELLDMVDTGQIKFNPAVELSYLASEEQKDFFCNGLCSSSSFPFASTAN